MDFEEIQKLSEELIQYTIDVGEGKHFEIVSLEIRTKIDTLNAMVDQAIDEENIADMTILFQLGYEYYRLYYG